MTITIKLIIGQGGRDDAGRQKARLAWVSKYPSAKARILSVVTQTNNSAVAPKSSRLSFLHHPHHIHDQS